MDGVWPFCVAPAPLILPEPFSPSYLAKQAAQLSCVLTAETSAAE